VFLIWYPSRPTPSSPSSRHKSPSSPRTRSPPPRVVTPRGFTSTSTSSLNYPPSYSSNAIRRSSVDRRSPSPALPRAASPSTPSRPSALSPGPHRQHSLTIFSYDAPYKGFHFVALACGSFKSHPPRTGPHGHFGALQGDLVKAQALGYTSQTRLSAACVPLHDSSAHGEKAALLRTGSTTQLG
jgi:hypothetical protein